MGDKLFGGHTAEEVAELCDMLSRENDPSISEMRSISLRARDCINYSIGRIASLQQQLEWISVEDRLPKYGEKVLVVSNDVIQEAVYFLDSADETADWFECASDRDITFWASDAQYWLPLPAYRG